MNIRFENDPGRLMVFVRPLMPMRNEDINRVADELTRQINTGKTIVAMPCGFELLAILKDKELIYPPAGAEREALESE